MSSRMRSSANWPFFAVVPPGGVPRRRRPGSLLLCLGRALCHHVRLGDCLLLQEQTYALATHARLGHYSVLPAVPSYLHSHAQQALLGFPLLRQPDTLCPLAAHQ